MSLDIWIVCQREPPSPRDLIEKVLDPSWVEDGILQLPLGEGWSGVELHGLLIDHLRPGQREERAIQTHHEGPVGALLLLTGRADDWEFTDALAFIERLVDHTGGVAYDQQGVIYRAGHGSKEPAAEACTDRSASVDPAVEWARSTPPLGQALTQVLTQAVSGDQAGTARLSSWTRRFSWTLAGDDERRAGRRLLGEGLLEQLSSTPLDSRDVLLTALLELRYTEGLATLRKLFARSGIPYRQMQYLEQLEQLAREGQRRAADNDWSDL